MSRKEIDNQSGDGELGRVELNAGDNWIGIQLSAGTVTLMRVYEADTEDEELVPLQDGQWTASQVRLVRAAAVCSVAVVGSNSAAGVTVWRE